MARANKSGAKKHRGSVGRPKKIVLPLTEQQRVTALKTMEAWVSVLDLLAQTLRGVETTIGAREAVMSYLQPPDGLRAFLEGPFLRKEAQMRRRRDQVLAAILQLLRPRGGAQATLMTLRDIHIQDAADLIDQFLDEPGLSIEPGKRERAEAIVRQGLVPAILQARNYDRYRSKAPLEPADLDAAQLERELWDQLAAIPGGDRIDISTRPRVIAEALEPVLFNLGDDRIKQIVNDWFKHRESNR